MAKASAVRTSSKSASVKPPVKEKVSSVKEKAASTVKKGAKVLKVVEQYYARHTVDTKGTFRFTAVDPKTRQVLKGDDKNAHATQLYVQRNSSALSSDPKFLKITIEEISALPKGATASPEEDD